MANQVIKADGVLRLLRMTGKNGPAVNNVGLSWEVRKPDGTTLDTGTGYGAGASALATFEGWSGYGFANPDFGNTVTLSVAASVPNGVGYELRMQSAFYSVNSADNFQSTLFDVGANAVTALATYAIVVDGDSITAGYGTSKRSKTYPEQFYGLLPANSGGYDLLNGGAFGIKISELAADTAINAAGWVANYAAANVTFLLMAGTNDIATGETNDATIYNNLVTRAKTLVGTRPGSRIAVHTLLPRWTTNGDAADVARKSVYDAVNVRIRGLVGMPTGTILLDDASLSQFAYPPNVTYLPDYTHPNDAGALLMANNALSLFPAQSTAPTTDPYQSNNAIPVQVTPDYKPGTPGPLNAQGLGTINLAQVVLTYPLPTDLPGGRIVFLRRIANSGTAFAIVGNVTGANSTTEPVTTWTDTAVTNGIRYEYTAYALPFGDF